MTTPTKQEALAALETLNAAVESKGAPTLHMNRQVLRQLLEPLRDFIESTATELDEANDGLAALTADIEGLGVDGAPWPETLEAIKAAMRIEKLKESSATGLDAAERRLVEASLALDMGRSRCGAHSWEKEAFENAVDALLAARAGEKT